MYIYIYIYIYIYFFFSRKDVHNSELTDLVQRNLATEVTGQLEEQHMQIFESIGLMGS